MVVSQREFRDAVNQVNDAFKDALARIDALESRVKEIEKGEKGGAKGKA